MGGLVGYAALDGLEVSLGSALLSRMLDGIVERAPAAGRGTTVAKNFGLGVLRQPDDGASVPYRSPRGDFAVAIDGRPQVAEGDDKGAAGGGWAELRTLHDRDGEDFVRQLDGAFALALWEGRSKRLVLARDRFGQKPLFVAWARGGRLLLFASEAKGLLASGEIPGRIDGRAVLDILSLGFPVPPRTFVSDVSALPPGTYLSVEGMRNVRRGRYSTPAYPRIGASSHESPPDSLRRCLNRSLAEPKPAAAACLISSGPASVLLADVLSRRSDRLTLIGGTFDVPGHWDEEPAWIGRLAARIGAEPAVVSLNSLDEGDYLGVLRALEAPPLGLEPLFQGQLYAALKAEGHRSVFVAEGASALLAGAGLHKSRPVSEGALGAGAWFGLGTRSTPGLTRAMREGAARRGGYERRWGAIPGPIRSWAAVAHLADRLLTRRYPPPPGPARFPRDLPGEPLLVASTLHRRLRIYQAIFLAGNTLVRSDRLASRFEIEVHRPFLSSYVTDWSAAQRPARLGAGLGLAMVRLELPAGRVGGRARRRRERPALFPDPVWPFGPGTPEWVRAALSANRLAELGLFDPQAVAAAQARVHAHPRARMARLEAQVLRGALGIGMCARALGLDEVDWPS